MKTTLAVSVDRRRFLQAATGSLALMVGFDAVGQAAEARKCCPHIMHGGTVDDPLVFVSIAAGGTVTMVPHRAEMGLRHRVSLDDTCT